MPQFAIHRAEKVSSFASLKRIGRHNHRHGEIPNADPDRRILNEVLVGSDDVEADVRAKLVAVGLNPDRLRKNGVIAAELLFSATPEYFRPNGEGYGEYDPARLETWKAATMAHLQRRWGPDRVANAVLHLDEATPHIQAVVLPIDDTPRKKGAAVRLNAARWLDGTPKLQRLQDNYHEDVAHLGLERGLRGSKARHRPVRRAYAEFSTEVAKAKQERIEAEQERTAAASSRAAAERDRAAAQQAHELAEKELAEAHKARAEAAKAREQAKAAEQATERSLRRSEGLLRGAELVGRGVIVDGIQSEDGRCAFVWAPATTPSERKTMMDWIPPEARTDVWNLARHVADQVRRALAPVVELVEQADKLRPWLEQVDRSNVDAVKGAVRAMLGRSGRGLGH